MPKPYRFRIFFTLFGLFLCLLNWADLDPRNLIFYSFSVPVWFIDAFYDIHLVDLFFVYSLTVAAYFILGTLCDWMINIRTRANR